MLGSTEIVAFVPITNPEKARAFYEGVLGLDFLKDDGFALVFVANGTMIRMARVQDHKPVPFTILGWQVDDIERRIRGLQAKGIQFERYGFFKQDDLGVWTAPTGDKVAWFKDPDGNTLSLSQHA